MVRILCRPLITQLFSISFQLNKLLKLTGVNHAKKYPKISKILSQKGFYILLNTFKAFKGGIFPLFSIGYRTIKGCFPSYKGMFSEL